MAAGSLPGRERRCQQLWDSSGLSLPAPGSLPLVSFLEVEGGDAEDVPPMPRVLVPSFVASTDSSQQDTVLLSERLRGTFALSVLGSSSVQQLPEIGQLTTRNTRQTCHGTSHHHRQAQELVSGVSLVE